MKPIKKLEEEEMDRLTIMLHIAPRLALAYKLKKRIPYDPTIKIL